MKHFQVTITLDYEAQTAEHAVAIAEGDLRDPARPGLIMRVDTMDQHGQPIPGESVLLDSDDCEYPNY